MNSNMRNFLYKLQQFMYGRNGVDGFGIFLAVIYMLLRSTAAFSRSIVLYILSLLLIIFVIYRIFSTNLYQRHKENDFFMRYYGIIASWFKGSAQLSRERAQFRPTHKIYVCPKCKKHLKVPKGKGKIEISCPCGNKFTKRT